MVLHNLPLERFKVLDLTRVRSGPTAVKVLADWGADVIKIEMPPQPDQDDGYTGSRYSADFQNLHRNKRSITLNLKKEKGKQIFYHMVEQADVVVENFRPQVKFRLGIDFETLKNVNPKLIMASISGFGQTGPYSERPGVDQIAQGMGGFMSVTGIPGQGPLRAGTAIADLTCGMNCATAILVALLQREVTNEGQWVHTSLLESQIALMDFQCARFLIENDVPVQAGNNHPKSIPTGVFPTSDGYINISAGGQNMWLRLCAGLEAELLTSVAEYKTAADRLKNRDALNEAIAGYTKTKTSQEWVDILNTNGVPCGPIYTVDQTFSDPQVQHLGIAWNMESPDLGEISVLGQPFSLSSAVASVRRHTPNIGEHTDEVLLEMGYKEEEISQLYKLEIL
ncbi:MAG: formyl-CoA transferase [Rhodospirillaceae bacterium]|nr:formyl-CoA transferase [Rhodospirillaceae bacterium]